MVAGLLERDGELDELRAAAAAAGRRDGAVVVLEGPAGIGKTALLRAARELAREHGMAVLSAIGSPLDRDFAFGLVHQLLAAVPRERCERALTGTAALAEPVVLGGEAPATSAADPGHAVLHGLYWAFANLADEEPVALIVDDLHWGDRASLRFLEFLSRRLEGLPVLVLTATRTGEPGAEEELLSALASSARVLRPAPLSASAVSHVLADALGAEPAAPFTDAAANATGGNPLLLAELSRAATERGLHGDAEEAADLAGIGGAGVAGHVRRRLAALGSDATAVAQAAALLGERARLDDVAALAGVDEATSAVDLLVGAGVLEADTRAFVHPLVREAVAAEIPPARRAALHGAAARRLAERGARSDEVAVHLLATEPAGEEWVVERLRAAARAAVAEGMPESGVPHLRRAVAEPPSAEARAGVLHELGLLEAAAGHPDALDHLAQALADGLAPEQRPIALAMRARVALYRDPPAAFEELQTALAEARDPGLALRLEATALDATMYDLALFDRRPELLARPGEPSPARLAHMAIDAGYAPEHRDEVDALARRALAAGDLSALLGAESAAVHLLVQAVRNVELPALAAELVDAMEAAARREGSRIGLFMASHARAFWNWWFGSLSTAEAHARAGLEVTEAAGLNVARFSMLIILAEVLRERGNLDEAEALLATVTFGAAEENSIIGPDFLAARGLVHWLRARRDDAEHDLRRATELLWARGWRNPLKGRAALRLAELLAEQGRTHEARELASGELDTARAAAIPGAEGMALRVLGRVEASEELHRSAVERLEQSAMALERAWALHDLGAHQRRGGRRIDARDTLRAALDIADRHGAGELGDLVRAELVQAGARPRRSAAIGPESLTPSERRVAELAARGLSNREIAETLWVTRKTVEVHLGHTYSKLGIRTRGELPAALAGGS